MILLTLSKEHSELPEWEVKELLHLKAYERKEHFLIISRWKKDIKQLAYTKKAGKIVLQGKRKKLEKKLSTLHHPTSSFILRCPQHPSQEKTWGSILHQSLKKPVKSNPETIFELSFTKKEFFLTVLLWENKERFQERRNHLLPAPHPSSMQPKLARALVNMLGTKTTITDPFCGSGGVLIEAGLMGHTIKGYDISEAMIARAKKNLGQFNLKATLNIRDATTIKNIPYFVADLPYGISTSPQDINKLLKNFLNGLQYKKGVICLPSAVRLKGRKTFLLPLHKTLTKRIVLL